MNTYGYAGANPANLMDPLGLDVLQVLGADFKAGYQSGGILGGINGVINGLPSVGTPQCLVTAAQDLKAAAQAIGVALDLKDAYDFAKNIADAAAGDFGALVNGYSTVGQWLQQNSPCYGDTCKPGVNPLGQPNQDINNGTWGRPNPNGALQQQANP